MNALVFPSRQIGEFQVTALSDGTMSASLDLLSGIEKVDAESLQHNVGIAQPGDIHINGYLVRGQGRTLLIDAGTGSDLTGGELKANLAAAGVSAEEVDTILLTHCHPDHIGGLLDAEGEPVYKQAVLHLHSLEAEYWLDSEKEKGASERGKRNFALVRQTLKAYGDNVRFINGNAIIPEIVPLWLPGHTPGHTGFRIDSGDQSLLIWGDIVHFPHIQSACPTVSIAFDVDPVQASETRQKILEQAAQEKLLIAGMHLAKAGFARVLRAENGYRLAYSEE